MSSFVGKSPRGLMPHLVGGKAGPQGVGGGGIEALTGITGMGCVVLADNFDPLDPAVTLGHKKANFTMADGVLPLGLGGAGETKACRQHTTRREGQNHHPKDKPLAV